MSLSNIYQDENNQFPYLFESYVNNEILRVYNLDEFDLDGNCSIDTGTGYDEIAITEDTLSYTSGQNSQNFKSSQSQESPKFTDKIDLINDPKRKNFIEHQVQLFEMKKKRQRLRKYLEYKRSRSRCKHNQEIAILHKTIRNLTRKNSQLINENQKLRVIAQCNNNYPTNYEFYYFDGHNLYKE